MIRVRIKRKKNGNISSFEMSGHAEFAGYGQDIVCAGASAVSFGTVNAIMEVAGVDLKSASPKAAFWNAKSLRSCRKNRRQKCRFCLKAWLYPSRR
ncbi:ribosomal-processing cysteine protease Prp [Heyndrickxia coagulans]|uniref:ribosomal-processing cysteine protease Prp n=1 Tax=Heyndrickxia coagulans TaxID=1398 RepID=UPI0034634E73